MSDSLVPASVSMPTSQEGLEAWGFPDWNSGLLPFLQRRQLRVFLNLLENRRIWDCLHEDRRFKYSDKYLLAMVLVYFQRAHLLLHEYTQDNFFLALFLANDIYEDLQGAKVQIIISALGEDWYNQKRWFLHQRDKLWARMDFRAIVSRQSCEEVMAGEPNHWAWSRERCPLHVGVRVHYPWSPRCDPLCSNPRCAVCPFLGWPNLPSTKPAPLPYLPRTPPECLPCFKCLSVVRSFPEGKILVILSPTPADRTWPRLPPHMAWASNLAWGSSQAWVSWAVEPTE
ncbi:speedy protein C [Oryctolagus cuniculus]|uniref:speedy protein C n=1 Tax=Oryctolagus cuniculus TaxID=9986 RepID=UPI003879316A